MKDDFNDTVGRKSVQPAGPLERELLDACENGKTVKVAELIKKGANIFVESEKPLLLAAENGHLEVVKLLVAEGSLGIMRYTAPTFAAEENGHMETADYLRQAMKIHRNLKDSFNQEPTPKEVDTFVRAAGNGAEAAVKAFLDKYPQSADILNFYNTYAPKTALMAAAAKGNIDTIKLLLSKGADINKKGGSGWTAVSMAAQGGKTDAVALLLDNGAFIDNESSDYWSPLSQAIQHLHADTIKYLLDKGASIDIALRLTQEQKQNIQRMDNGTLKDEWLGRIIEIVTLLEQWPAQQKPKPSGRHFKI